MSTEIVSNYLCASSCVKVKCNFIYFCWVWYISTSTKPVEIYIQGHPGLKYDHICWLDVEHQQYKSTRPRYVHNLLSWMFCCKGEINISTSVFNIYRTIDTYLTLLSKLWWLIRDTYFVVLSPLTTLPVSKTSDTLIYASQWKTITTCIITKTESIKMCNITMCIYDQNRTYYECNPDSIHPFTSYFDFLIFLLQR